MPELRIIVPDDADQDSIVRAILKVEPRAKINAVQYTSLRAPLYRPAHRQDLCPAEDGAGGGLYPVVLHLAAYRTGGVKDQEQCRR